MDDYRMAMTRATFDAIPIDPMNAIGSLWDRVIDANPRLMTEDFGDANFLAKVTPSLRLFLVLGVFDGQVSNGGIVQFFWNCPGTIFAVRGALAELGELELLGLYDRAVTALVGNGESWESLRTQGAELAPNDAAWEPFQKSYDLLDLGWFDKAYFDTWGHNSVNEWVVLSEGLSRRFAQNLVSYVRTRPGDFISG
ncbi:DMP19 family protein [Frigoriglobus tundricola]|uniref:DMP19 family protein n=1 Tax=Frigoriglobus tundricola TaxID=2774151 RepID=UPI00148ED9F5|nr:DUF4375 domain-containing protein [Frigoriglobus tundricola]